MSIKRGTIFNLLLAFALVPASAATAPPNPYIDKGACPFECCTYRDWKATKPITRLDQPNGKKRVAQISAGSTVHAVTGEVISAPTAIVARQAYADSPIRKGDTFYFLHYAGEGYSLVWYKGKTFDVDLDQSGATPEGPPDGGAAWWAQIRIPDGKSGWVRVNDQFENQDSCG